MYTEKFIQGSVSENRIIKPKGLVTHHTGIYSVESIINTFTNRKNYASAHVLILANGDRIRFAEDNQRAWHAGKSVFNGRIDCNSYMLGVEFHGDTNVNPLTQDQIGSFIDYFIPRKEKYNIVFDYVTDHKIIRNNFIEKYCSIVNGNAFYKEKVVYKKTDLNPIEFEKLMKVVKQLYI